MTLPNVLLLPGLLEDADGFAHQMAGLAEVAACTVADLTRSDTMAGLAHDALSQAPEGKVAIVGHSMGGYVALEIARRAPERVAALALLNTNARPDSAESTENRRRLLDLAARDFDAVIKTLMQKQLIPAHLADPAITATITQMAHAVGREAFARQQKAIMGRIDSRPHLGAIRCPTLVLAGRGDAIMPVEVLEELARGIPGAKLEIVEESGHMTQLEQPEAVTRALHIWLTGEPGEGVDVVAGTRRPPPT
jgi:pimeloyl-ACP methyl ester carboxylesterase